MNGSYIQGATAKARIAIAARAIMELYYHRHPTHRYLGMTPNYNHFEQYMEAFVAKEDHLSRLDERSNDDSPSGLHRRRELSQLIKDDDVRIAGVLALIESSQ